MHLAASEKGISVLSFGRRYEEDNTSRNDVAKRWLNLTEHALRNYFQGDPRAFQKIPIDIKGTVFQKKVWQALKQIPAGKTLSYGAIATRIGHPKAFRAVGTACASNPVALIVPCHRAVGSGKSLGGFAWGIQRKKKLLRLENPQFQNSQ